VSWFLVSTMEIKKKKKYWKTASEPIKFQQASLKTLLTPCRRTARSYLSLSVFPRFNHLTSDSHTQCDVHRKKKKKKTKKHWSRVSFHRRSASDQSTCHPERVSYTRARRLLVHVYRIIRLRTVHIFSKFYPNSTPFSRARETRLHSPPGG